MSLSRWRLREGSCFCVRQCGQMMCSVSQQLESTLTAFETRNQDDSHSQVPACSKLRVKECAPPALASAAEEPHVSRIGPPPMLSRRYPAAMAVWGHPQPSVVSDPRVNSGAPSVHVTSSTPLPPHSGMRMSTLGSHAVQAAQAEKRPQALQDLWDDEVHAIEQALRVSPPLTLSDDTTTDTPWTRRAPLPPQMPRSPLLQPPCTPASRFATRSAWLSPTSASSVGPAAEPMHVFGKTTTPASATHAYTHTSPAHDSEMAVVQEPVAAALGTARALVKLRNARWGASAGHSPSQHEQDWNGPPTPSPRSRPSYASLASLPLPPGVPFAAATHTSPTSSAASLLQHAHAGTGPLPMHSPPLMMRCATRTSEVVPPSDTVDTRPAALSTHAMLHQDMGHPMDDGGKQGAMAHGAQHAGFGEAQARLNSPVPPSPSSSSPALQLPTILTSTAQLMGHSRSSSADHKCVGMSALVEAVTEAEKEVDRDEVASLSSLSSAAELDVAAAAADHLLAMATTPTNRTSRIGAYSPEQRKLRLERFWHKRTERVWAKRGSKYAVRQRFAEARTRVRGRFISKAQEHIMRSSVMSMDVSSTATTILPAQGCDMMDGTAVRACLKRIRKARKVEESYGVEDEGEVEDDDQYDEEDPAIDHYEAGSEFDGDESED